VDENPPSDSRQPESTPARLDSWKDIASYLKRDVSTVQRWEKREGMPVHRHLHDKAGSVYSFPAEIDAWWHSREMHLLGNEAEGDERAVAEWPVIERSGRRRRILWLTATLAAVTLAATVVWLLERNGYFWNNPLSNARFVRLTDWEGTERAAAISRDGKFVAFLSDRSGSMDVWVTQVGSGRFYNLTKGAVQELINPDVRTLGFSPDATLVSLWVRRQSASRAADIGVWTVPTLGGEPTRYLEGVAEIDWSSDGTRLVYHTPGPGDPMFISDNSRRAPRAIFKARSGLHAHFPVWSPDDHFIYFVHGALPNQLDIWRIPAGGGLPERMTSLNTRVTYPVFVNRRTLLYLAVDDGEAGPAIHALDTDRRTTRRVSFGVERYTSLAASADGRRLVATMANPTTTVWRAPIADDRVEKSAATRVTLPTAHGRAPRIGPGFVIYVASSNNADGIWKVADARATELWTASGARILGGPAISPDGRRVAFSAEERGRKRMYVMNADGSATRVLSASLEPQGTPAWAPDGQSIAVGATINRAPCLATVSPDRQTFRPLVSGFAADPAWSPDGSFVVYSGPDVGTTFQIRAVRSNGQLQRAPNIMLTRGARRLAFLRGPNVLIIARGDMDHKNLYAIDLDSGRERQITNFGPDFVVGDFDISADGRAVLLEREHDDSDIVLIER
jgi:Tol biopolymer transport system component